MTVRELFERLGHLGARSPEMQVYIQCPVCRARDELKYLSLIRTELENPTTIILDKLLLSGEKD